MPHGASRAAPGIQALILCGPGSSFTTFTTNPDENPKALLPIANRPMVWYPLDFCYRMGITDITLITPPSAAQALSAALATNPFLTSLPSPKANMLAPEGLDFNTGTAEILRLADVRSAVTSDFVVLPCDLVCELGGDKLLQAWMVKSASLTDIMGEAFSGSGSKNQHSGGLAVYYETKSETPIKGQETDFVAVVPAPARKLPTPPDSVLNHVSRVVYSIPTNSLNDLVEEKNGLPLRHALLRKHPRIRMLTSHRDAHIYILPRWVISFVNENTHFDTIGEDLLGWWAKATWQRGLAEKLGLHRILAASEPAVNGTSTREGSQSPMAHSSSTDSPGQLHVKLSPTSAQTVAQPKSDHIPPLMAYIQPKTPSSPLIRRVDNAQLLLSTSLQLAKLLSVDEVGPDVASPFAHARKVAYPEGVRPRTTITQVDSLVAENVTVQEKSSIKESVVGANCQIGEGAKLVQCLLMDGVAVGKNCRLTKCILGRRSDIGEGCVLTECEVQENLLVEPKTEAKAEKLMSSSGLEATEEEFQEALDGEEALPDHAGEGRP